MSLTHWVTLDNLLIPFKLSFLVYKVGVILAQDQEDFIRGVFKSLAVVIIVIILPLNVRSRRKLNGHLGGDDTDACRNLQQIGAFLSTPSHDIFQTTSFLICLLN